MDSRKEANQKTKLEIVLKCDSVGSVEAITTAISKISSAIEISVIHSGLGAVNKSDVLLAETGSRLIVGFQVDVQREMDRAVREHNVEVRLYQVIYDLTDDIKAIAESKVPSETGEEIIGSARVIALFKSSRRAIITGCEVSAGYLALGQRFRIISAAGPVYVGIIESIHIGDAAVQKAVPGQKAGIKIKGFSQVRIGDLIESFRPAAQKHRAWQPGGRIIRK